MPSGPAWDRNGPCASPIPTRPESVVSRTISSLTRPIVEVEVRTGCGKGRERKYVSRAVMFISRSPRAMIQQEAGAPGWGSRRPPMAGGWGYLDIVANLAHERGTLMQRPPCQAPGTGHKHGDGFA